MQDTVQVEELNKFIIISGDLQLTSFLKAYLGHDQICSLYFDQTGIWSFERVCEVFPIPCEQERHLFSSSTCRTVRESP